MGSFQSTHVREQEPPQEVGEGMVEQQETQTRSDSAVDKSCAISEKEVVGEVESYKTVDDGSAEDPDEFESCCDGNLEQCAELADFREDLARKRDLRKAKMADIKQEMEQLRASLFEERSKNRALIRYIQSKEQPPGSSDPATTETAVVAEALEQSSIVHDAEDTNTTTARLALKKDLAESQLQLQQANAELLSLHETIDQLRTQIHALQTPSEQEEAARDERNRKFRHLQAQLADAQFNLQISNAEVLSLQTDIGQLKTQIKGLKDVIKAGKEIINIREDQVEQLKAKLRQIEDSLAEREMQIMSADLRREYERQMANIRSLRELYEERERVSRMERDNLLRQLELRKNDLEAEQEKNKNLESHVASMQTDLEATKTELFQTKEKLSQSEAQARQLQSEMTVVNRFISKFLLGMSQKQATSSVRLDKLAEVLAENRDLLIEMTKQEAETLDLGAFLPRALYDLVAEVDDGVDEETESTANELPSEDEELLNEVQKASPEQIADKLPKVWRVLIELVNHQERAEQVQFAENGESEECLKTEQTKNGPKLVVSVSKTYLKLKDLILEKKSLKKETNRLKTLNTHLERRLEAQEKRLSVVSLELTKTWHLVGKMQRQHRQLHTQEQILRYHLQQKRRLLSELKEELEYCRIKWSAARQKNSESEDQWRQLKADFAARKQQDSLNASGESGYSDEQPTTDEDDEEVVAQELKKKLNRKGCGDLVKFHRSSSLGNVLLLQVAEMLEMRKCHSESDMKSLSNVERANQFCNEKIEDLPMFPEEEVACSVKKKTKKGRKKKKGGPETAEEMFLRLAGLGQDEDEDEDDSGEELPDDSECSEIEKIEQRESTPVKEPELTSEELFNMKREARLKRMAELNSRLDNYSTTPNTSNDNTVTEVDSVEAGPSSTVLTSNEQDVMQRRADRLERLEREAREFRNKLSRTVNRGSEISAQLDEIHNGFIARQSESPIPGSSSETSTPQTSEIPPEELALLTDREREYTQSRSDRLQQLEGHSQSLLDQMNRSLKRGSRLTIQLDMLHRRYGSDQQDQPTSSTAEAVEPQEQSVEPQPAEPVDSILLENSITIPPNGPIELILVSDEEILEEIDGLLPTPSNATSTLEEDGDGEGEEDGRQD